jgi:endonuclease/exonuclease/phosphatase family metal-dependent hydrolase
MKLITLNAWGGKLYDPLMDFLRENSEDTDVVCFQDVLFGSRPEFSQIQKARMNLCDEMQSFLTDFDAYIYRDPAESYIHGEILPLDVGCGQVIFVRKNMRVMENGGFRSHPDSPYHKGGDMVSGRCQWITVANSNHEPVTILNFHGLWQRNSQKKDTPERIEQSQKIKEFFGSHTGKKILCGDFNLTNDGEAMAMLEEGMANLIKEYAIPSTRNSHYPKEEKFADYILVSPDITVSDFKALPDEVSDHLALSVECI